MLDQIGRPRIDDLAYSVAASVRIGEPARVERSIEALRVAFPDFEAKSFVEGLPYEHAQDRGLVLGALVAATR